MEKSTTSRPFPTWSAWLLALPLLAGCGGDYYQVTDTGSGKSYYTRDLDRDDGHVRFTDKVNGDKVHLNSFEVKEISGQQYRNAVQK